MRINEIQGRELKTNNTNNNISSNNNNNNKNNYNNDNDNNNSLFSVQECIKRTMLINWNIKLKVMSHFRCASLYM